MRHYLIASIVFILSLFLSFFLLEYSSKQLYVMSVVITLLALINFFVKRPDSPILKIKIKKYSLLIASYRVWFVGSILFFCGVIIFVIDQKNPSAALFISLGIFFLTLGRINLKKNDKEDYKESYE